MKILANAFSLQMLNSIEPGEEIVLKIKGISKDDVNFDISAVGHADTAAVLSSILNKEVESNRVSITLNPEDTLNVAQVFGGRLPEGCTVLPEGTTIKFIEVSIISGGD